MLPIAVGRASEVELPAHGDELGDDHGHRVVARVRVPVAATTVRRHHGHGRQGTTADLERDGLGRRHGGERIGVVGPESVQHHDQRQWAAGTVAGRPRDGVADLALPSRREEGSAPRRAEVRESQRRCRDRAGAVELVQLLTSGKHSVRHQFDARHAGCDQGRGTAEAERKEAATRPAWGRGAAPASRGRWHRRHVCIKVLVGPGHRWSVLASRRSGPDEPIDSGPSLLGRPQGQDGGQRQQDELDHVDGADVEEVPRSGPTLDHPERGTGEEEAHGQGGRDPRSTARNGARRVGG